MALALGACLALRRSIGIRRSRKTTSRTFLCILLPRRTRLGFDGWRSWPLSLAEKRTNTGDFIPRGRPRHILGRVLKCFKEGETVLRETLEDLHSSIGVLAEACEGSDAQDRADLRM